MTATEQAPASASAAAARDRCRQLGMPTWRFDTGGAVVDEPSEPGLAGLWLRSAEITRRVAAAAATLTQSPSQVVTLFDGCWLVALTEERRARRVGLMVAMALSESALSSEAFVVACTGAQLEPVATRNAVRKFARFDESSARAAGAMLGWMARDLAALAEYQEAVRGFTNELTQSYETISLLYSLGQSMGDLEHPDRFVAMACDRLHDTIPFAWLAAAFVPDPRVCGTLAGRTLTRGTPRLGDSELGALVSQLSSRTGRSFKSFLVNAAGLSDGESQLLVQPIARGGKLAGALISGDKFGEDPQLSSYDIQLLEAAAAFVGAFLDNAGLYADQRRMFVGALKALTASIDAKDRYTRGHSERVALLSAQLARAVGMDDREAERVHICGLVHDVGKIGVPEAVLTKPGRLSDEEFRLIKLHPEIGHRILKDIPELEDILPGVLHHHERWDGRGYPHGVAGEAIPRIARILAVADTFDAMSSTRSYRAAMSRARVLDEIARCAGTQFDPQLAPVFVGLDFAAYDAMVARHSADMDDQIRAAA